MDFENGPMNRLTEDEARKEADMMRAQMDMVPSGPNAGKIERGDNVFLQEPQAEDYEAAVRAIDELRTLAENEPTSEKILYALARLYQSSAKATGLILDHFGSLVSLDTSGNSQVALRQKFDEAQERFWDASHRLKKTERLGEKFASQKSERTSLEKEVFGDENR